MLKLWVFFFWSTSATPTHAWHRSLRHKEEIARTLDIDDNESDGGSEEI
jgi:hypothetical protein